MAKTSGSIEGGAGSLSGLTDGKFVKKSAENKSTTQKEDSKPIMLFSDTEEITLDSKYYSAKQPFLPKVLVQFPSSVTQNSSGVVEPTYAEAKDNLLDIRPNNLLNFTFDEIANGVGSFSLTLYDSSWHKVEDSILKSKGAIRIRFGYEDDNATLVSITDKSTSLSPWYNCFISSYSIKFGIEGVTLFIVGLTQGYQLNMVKMFNAFSGQTTIDKIVEKIAKDHGFTNLEIEPTKGIVTRESLESTEEGQKIFHQQGVTSLYFIIDSLIPFANNESGQGNYKFFIKNTEKGAELHFHTPYYKTKNASKKVPTFTLHKSGNSPVISFDPLWSMSLVQILGSGHIFSAIIDANTKATIPYSVDMNSVPQSFDNKPRIVMLTTEELNSSKNKVKTFSRELVPCTYPSEQIALVNTSLSERYMAALEASLKVQGTISFNLCDKIAVIVYVPQQDRSLNRNIHWISGYYRILNIKHEISAGSFTTTFKLFTDGRSNEVLTAVMVTNPETI